MTYPYNAGGKPLLVLVTLAAALLGAACGSDVGDTRPDARRDTGSLPDSGPTPDSASPIDARPDAAVDTATPGDAVVDALVPADSNPSGDVGPVDAAPDTAIVDAARDAEVDAAGPDAGPDSAVDTAPRGPLLGYWPLDEGNGTVTADLSGNGNPGTLVGGAMFLVSGHNAGSVVLDGVDDFVELGVGAIPATNAPKTVSLWFYIEGTPNTGRENMIALTNLDLTSGVQIGLAGGRVTCWLAGDDLPLVIADINAPAPTDSWHHLAYTYNGTNHQLYLDGGTTIGVSSTPVMNPGPVLRARLGSFDFLGEMFGGRIDDVRVYDRALDAAAIATLAAGGVPTVTP